MDDPAREIASRLRAARKAARITQARLARRAGITRETVYRAEGGRLPSADTLARMADALGVDRDEFDLKCAATDAFANHAALTLLRDRRRARALTLAECSLAAGVSPATLSRFERGVERNRKLVGFDAAGHPRRMINEGLARVLGFSSVEALDHYWRTGRDPDQAARIAAAG